MQFIRSSLLGVALALVVTPAALAEKSEGGATKTETLSLDAVVTKHIAALGGEKLLRGGTTFAFTVTGEKMGKKFSKTVTQARPNKMRVDVISDEGPGATSMSKGFDGKVAWVKKGNDKAVAMNADETKSMEAHAIFEEPLLDYAKKGTKVKLAGKTDAAYDLEVTYKNGDVEHHFIDAKSFYLVKKTFTSKDKDGKKVEMSVGFGDYKMVQGRAVNHSVSWDDNGKTSKSVVSKVSFDGKVDASIFSMPK